MLSWAVTFLIIAIIAAVLGFGGIAGAATGIAKILFIVFLVLFVASFFFGRRGKAEHDGPCFWGELDQRIYMLIEWLNLFPSQASILRPPEGGRRSLSSSANSRSGVSFSSVARSSACNVLAIDSPTLAYDFSYRCCRRIFQRDRTSIFFHTVCCSKPSDFTHSDCRTMAGCIQADTSKSAGMWRFGHRRNSERLSSNPLGRSF